MVKKSLRLFGREKAVWEGALMTGRRGRRAQRAVLLLLLCLLLSGCAPRAREYSAIATPSRPPTATLFPASTPATLRINQPPARFDVPTGWSVSEDKGWYTLQSPTGLQSIVFFARPRVYPKYTYKKELKALTDMIKKMYVDVEITFESSFYELGAYSGVECIYTGIPQGAGATEEKVHTAIFFEGGNEYGFTLTTTPDTFFEGEQALKVILFSMQLG